MTETGNIKKNLFDLLISDSDNSDIEDNKDNKDNNDNKNKNKDNIIPKINNNLSNTISNKIEDDMFKQYYGKKKNNYNTNNYNTNNNNNYNNTNNYNNNNMGKFNKNNESLIKPDLKKIEEIIDDNPFIVANSKKKFNKIENHLQYKNIGDDFEKIFMKNYFRVLGHHNDDKSWDYSSYHNITILSKYYDLGTFFNTLNKSVGECKYTDFDIFLMKNEISPMWEDKENRNGSICSIKIDSINEGYNVFKELTFNIINNTLLKINPTTWDTVNGISFSPKKIDSINPNSYCIIIKLWFKINIINYGSIDKILTEYVNNLIIKYSIKIKQIKPEY